MYAGVAVLGLLITTLTTSVLASAHGFGGPFTDELPDDVKERIESVREEIEAYREEHKEELQEKFAEMHEEKIAAHEDLEAAIENNDYEAWKALMLERGIDESKLTVENFEKVKQMHQLMKEAREKMEAARAIGEELGFPGQGPKHFGHTKFLGHGKMMGDSSDE